MKLSQSVADGIEDRLKRIQDDPAFFSVRASEIEDELRHDADLHSFWLEYPDLRRELLLEYGAERESQIKRMAQKGVKNIKRAWQYLNSEQFKESRAGVLGFFTPETIEQVGKYIHPDGNADGFRKEYVHSPFQAYSPRSPELVPVMINQLCKYVQAMSHKHPVELAAEAHLRIAGIQPFRDGNKRTARLVERRILEAYGLPTSFIPCGERGIYIDLIKKALNGLKENRTNEQIPFFDYIAGKVTVALDKIIDDLRI
jgi:hypothetical protein